MSPVVVAPMRGSQDVFQSLTADEPAQDAASAESRTLVSALHKVRQQVLGDRISLVFDILGAGLTYEGKVYWLGEPYPFLDERRPLDLLAAGRFDEVWAAAESYLVGDFV